MKFIPVAFPIIGEEEKRNVLSCLESTWISSTGKYIQKFEKTFAKRCNAKYASSCNNGTAALHLALLALSIGPGDEVILPAFTFIATANVIAYVGAKPVFVDIHPHTWNINPDEIEAAITPHTKAIIAVHLYGYPAEMGPIMKIAKKYKIAVIEDAAEAHLALYNNQPVGSIGDIGCFSFFGNKIITTGEGGIVITNQKSLINKINLFKNHGMSSKKKYFHPVVGYNYRMTNIQAAIGYAQVKKIDGFLKRRREIEKMYRNGLAGIPEIIYQPEQKHIKQVCWLFSILINSSKKNRKKLISYLFKNGIDSRPFFYPVINFPMYKSNRAFPVTKKISQTGLNLPSSPLLSDAQVEYIAAKIRSFFL